MLPEYQYCDCSGSDIGPRRFTLDPRIENRRKHNSYLEFEKVSKTLRLNTFFFIILEFIKVDNNQIASPDIAIFSEHFTVIHFIFKLIIILNDIRALLSPREAAWFEAYLG